MTDINSFSGPNRYLSNFWFCDIYHDGIDYCTIEHAFQAAKTLDFTERIRIGAWSTPGEAKRAGRTVTLRGDWEGVKNLVMYELVLQKFAAYADLRASLLGTGDVELVEGNTWGDRYWGVCNGVGTNYLGQILMRVRKELK